MPLQIRNTKRAGLLAKLGKQHSRALAKEVAPAEPRMARALYLKWVSAVFTLWLQHVLHQLDPERGDQRQDARELLKVEWDQLVERSGLKNVLNRIGRDIEQKNLSYFQKVVRTNPPAVGEQAQRITDFRKENVELISNMGKEMIADINETLTELNSRGARHEEIAKVIQGRVGVSKARAKLIARDQTLKHNAAVQQVQAQSLGFNEYTWSTSHDSAVRPYHRKLDGKKFDYNDPPVTNEDGDRNNPGEDYNCRCVAIPVIPLFAGLDDDTTTGTLAE